MENEIINKIISEANVINAIYLVTFERGGKRLEVTYTEGRVSNAILTSNTGQCDIEILGSDQREAITLKVKEVIEGKSIVY